MESTGRDGETLLSVETDVYVCVCVYVFVCAFAHVDSGHGVAWIIRDFTGNFQRRQIADAHIALILSDSQLDR